MGLFDLKIINKYDCAGPRYTSYPTANRFDKFDNKEYAKQALISNENKRPLSIYCHIPFCNTVCYYCGCNKVVTKDKNKAKPYISRLFHEIDMQSLLFDSSRVVEQMHFGGGTPTFLSDDELSSISSKLQSQFNFSDNGEYSIEIDPRGVGEKTIKTLARAKFNRISLGVQDFNIDVQRAVNRVQSSEQTKQVINVARRNGVNSVKSIVEEAYKSGIQYLTLYAFSIENWDRPSDEINILMSLLVSTLRDEFDEIFDKGIKLNAIGEIKSLPKELVSELDFIINKTRKNTKMTLTLALSYGGKQEIFNAIKIISNKVKNNLIELNNFDDSIINSHLYTKNLPDVDLLIRTSGEQRISNFLLWQIAYSELYFTDVYWPDFSKDDFNKAIENYKTRERRFGKTSEQI